jgi:hypothetical protein
MCQKDRAGKDPFLPDRTEGNIASLEAFVEDFSAARNYLGTRRDIDR